MTDTITRTAFPSSPLADFRGEQLAERIFESAIGAAELLTIELGHRLGLYPVLFDAGPVTPPVFSELAGIAERYAREWLEQQAAAGILDIVSDSAGPDEREFLLPGGHVPVLIDEVHPLHSSGLASLIAGLAESLPLVGDAFRSGKGVAFDRYGESVREGIGRMNRPDFVHNTRAWIDQVPDIAASLDAGGVVLDVGCGVGWSTIALAHAFPAARIVGVDLDQPSIERARSNAAEAGVADRTWFVVADAADESAVRSRLDEDYSLITMFQTLHDTGSPVRVLKALAGVLAPDGAILVADEAGSHSLESPADPLDRLRYSMSALHCVPATMNESPDVVNGTVLRPGTVVAWAAEAGITDTQLLPIEHASWRFYRMNPRRFS